MADTQLEALLLAIAHEPAPAWLESRDILADYLEERGDERSAKVRCVQVTMPKEPPSRIALLVKQAYHVTNPLFQGYVDYDSRYLRAFCPCQRLMIGQWVKDVNIEPHKPLIDTVLCEIQHWRLPYQPEPIKMYFGTCKECQTTLWFLQITEEIRKQADNEAKEELLNLFSELIVVQRAITVRGIKHEEELSPTLLSEQEEILSRWFPGGRIEYGAVSTPRNPDELRSQL